MASTPDLLSTSVSGAATSASSGSPFSCKTTPSVSPTFLASLNLSVASSSSASTALPTAISGSAATGTRKSSRPTKKTSRGAESEEQEISRVRIASPLKKVIKKKSVSPPKLNSNEKSDEGKITPPAEKKRYTLKFSPETIRKMKEREEKAKMVGRQLAAETEAKSSMTPQRGESSKSPAPTLPPKKTLVSRLHRNKGTSSKPLAPTISHAKPAKGGDTVKGISKKNQSSTSFPKFASASSITQSSKVTEEPTNPPPGEAATSRKRVKVATKPLAEVANSSKAAKATTKLAPFSTAKSTTIPRGFAAMLPATKRPRGEEDTQVAVPTPASKRARAHARGDDDTQVVLLEPATYRGRGEDETQVIFQEQSTYRGRGEDDTQDTFQAPSTYRGRGEGDLSVTFQPSNTFRTVATTSGVKCLPLKTPRMFTGLYSPNPISAVILTAEQEADRREFTTLYFAYGKDAGYTYFTQKFKANNAACYSTASLSGYKFTLHSDGYAKIYASAGDEVWGTLWLIPNATRRIIEAKAGKHGMKFVEVDGVQPMDRDPDAMPGNWYATPVATEVPLTVWMGVAEELDGNEHLGKQAIAANERKWQDLNAAIVYMYSEAVSNGYVEKFLRPWIPYPTTGYDSGYWTKKKAPKAVIKAAATDASKISPKVPPTVSRKA
ncbi:hypothetical protein QTJ16_002182 [Diplocarpon rosae]|uniref:Uncharacterized protein n=1 Tax=Diplocarpon rosae TaxID=946125 RepID=A0AAD9T5R3_9HELO|nr:hypothetical protein QTJ16_002182 [Diplocarpon rosae]